MATIIYDSAAVRRAARTVRSSLDSVTSTAQPRVRTLRNTLAENFEGAAADALAGRLRDLDADIERMASTLERLNRALNNFANEIDAADTKIKNSMQ